MTGGLLIQVESLKLCFTSENPYDLKLAFFYFSKFQFFV
jgi:hypothetical protein